MEIFKIIRNSQIITHYIYKLYFKYAHLPEHKLELSPTGIFIIVMIGQHKYQTISMIQQYSLLKQPTLSKSISNLIDLNYITKEIKGKEHWFCLSPKGQATYDEIINILLEVEKKIKKDVPQAIITNYLNASEELAKLLDDPLMK